MADTNAPAAAAVQFDAIADQLAAFMNQARVTAADGLTWTEFGELLLSLLRLVITTLDSVTTLSGEEKKSIALGAVERLFDAVADKAVPAAVYPLWLLVRPAVRSFVVAIASGSIEKLLPLVRA
jgi:hypothetical protein